jgi:hypothetical protein
MQTPILLLITKVGCLLSVFCFGRLRSPKPERPNCVLGSTGLCKAFNAHPGVFGMSRPVLVISGFPAGLESGSGFKNWRLGSIIGMKFND